MMMTPIEINLARRIIGLRGTSFYAHKNYWVRHLRRDIPTILAMQEKGHVETMGDGWKLSSLGIQQLKLQIGEFSFSKKKVAGYLW